MTRFACFAICVALCLGQTCGSPDLVPLPDGDSSPPETPPRPESPPVDDTLDISVVQGTSWQALWGTTTEWGAATAFAIDTHLLATNCHVAEPMAEALRSSDGWAVFVQHETGQEVYPVNIWVHPEWDGNLNSTPDVAIIEVDIPLTEVLSIADREVLYDLHVFDELAMCGFPGDVTMAVDFADREPGETFRPRATCLQGVITALRPFKASEALTPQNGQLVQNDIPLTQGTSGSAIVDANGQVVAVNSCGTTDEAGSNRFAPRADTLLDLWEGVKDGAIAPIPDQPIYQVPVEKPIPEGVYAGTRLFQQTCTFSGSTPTVSDIAESPFSVSFGSAGDLLGSDGSPVQVGHVRNNFSGSGVMAEETTAVTKGNAYFEYQVFVESVIQDSNVGPIHSSGTGTHAYRLQGDVLLYEGTVLLVSDPYYWGSVMTTWEYSATLTRR